MTDDPEVIDTDEPRGGVNTKLLIGLAGLSAIATILLIVRLTKTKPQTLDVGNVLDHEDWRASLEHFARNMEVRFAGIDDRLDALANAKVQGVAQAATVSAVPDPISPPEYNGTMVERIPPELPVEGEPAAPPAPAAVSVPPGADV